MDRWKKSAVRFVAAALVVAASTLALRALNSPKLGTPPPDRYYIWWEEDRSPAMEASYHELEQKQQALEEARRKARSEGADEKKFAAIKTEYDQIETWLALHQRREPKPWNGIKTPVLGLAGSLPEDVRERIPGDGRIEEASYTAAMRLVVNWEGKPVDLTDRLKEGSVLAAFERGELPMPKILTEEDHAGVRRLAAGKRVHGDVFQVKQELPAKAEKRSTILNISEYAGWGLAATCALLGMASAILRRPLEDFLKRPRGGTR